jgi:DeoR/GlpR family transcriptional regulator of sugar metabolism
MLAAERRRWILDALAREGKVVVADLTARLAVSHDTVRRDLQGLSAAGLLRRVHGGALPLNLTPLDIAERAEQAPAAKRALAKKAARLLRNDSVIVLSIGTSAIELAREVPRELKATVFTLSAPIAIELSSRPGLDIHLIGGRFEPLILETAGVEPVETLRRLRADVCFFGVWALHPHIGLSVGHIDDVPVL